MVKLFAKDRVIVAGAETAKEKCKQWESGIGNDYESIEDIDQLLSQNEATLESFDHMDDYMDKMTSPTSTQASNQSAQLKRKKWKVSNVKNNADEMIKVVQSMVEVIKEWNTIFEKSQPQVYSEQELWNDLQVMRLSQPMLTYAYLYMVENPSKRRAFFGCPFHFRVVKIFWRRWWMVMVIID